MKLLPLLLLFPTIASAEPLPLPLTNQPATAYDANSQRYDMLPSPLGSVVVAPNNERFDVIQKPDGGSVVYDQHGARVFESYPSVLEPAPLEQR